MNQSIHSYIDTTTLDSQVTSEKQGLTFKPTKLTACILATLSMAELLPSTVAAEINPAIQTLPGVSIGLRNDGVLFQFGGPPFTPVPLSSNVIPPLHPEAAILTNVSALPVSSMSEYGSGGGLALLYSATPERTALFTWQPQYWESQKIQPTLAVSDVKEIINPTGDNGYSRFVTTNTGTLFRLNNGYDNTVTQLAAGGISDVKAIVEGGSFSGNNGYGYNSYMVLTNTGTVFQGGWTWDNNQSIPVMPVPGLTNVKMVVPSGDRFYALTQVGEVYVWQWDNANNRPMTATKFTGLPSNVIQIKDGLAVTANGDVYQWVMVWNNATQTSIPSSPIKVSGLSGITQIIGQGEPMALTSAGELYMWNWDGNTQTPTVPTKVSGVSGASKVYYHNDGYLATTTDGKLYQWSMDWNQSPSVPKPATLVLSNVKDFFPKEFEQGNYYYGHRVALTQTGEVFLLGNDPNNFTATKINGVSQVSDVKISGGWPETTFVALTTAKEVYTWKWNQETNSLSTATKVSGLSNTTAIQIGGNVWGDSNLNHVIALKEDGMLCGWGNNSSGQLGAGNPTYVPITAPVCFEDLKVSSSTKLVMTPPPSICAGQEFEVKTSVKLENPNQPIETADLNLRFDPTRLEVVSLTPDTTVLDFTLQSDYDNSTGTIIFGTMDFDPPSVTPPQTVNLFTVRFKPKSSSVTNTVLDFDSSLLTQSGQEVIHSAEDQEIALRQCLKYKVGLQRSAAAPNASWQTPLKISVGTATSAKEYQSTPDTSGKGELAVEESLSLTQNEGKYLCVKSVHTLAKKVNQPFVVFSGVIDFSATPPINYLNSPEPLLEGDATDDNKIDTLDALAVSGCKTTPTATACLAKADFNGDGQVNLTDLKYTTAPSQGQGGNRGIVSQCRKDETLSLYRMGLRSASSGGGEGSGSLSLHVPKGLTVGQSFDVIIQMKAGATQDVQATEAFLNFDPRLLQVNSITEGNMLDMVLEKNFDNTQGQLNIATMAWDKPPRNTFTLATVNLTLLAVGGEQTLSFNEEDETRQTGAFAKNEPISLEEPEIIQDGLMMASGTLLDSNNQALAGVTVKIANQTATTDAAGYWEVANLADGKYTATATKEGYNIVPNDFTINKKAVTVNFVVSASKPSSPSLTILKTGDGRGTVQIPFWYTRCAEKTTTSCKINFPKRRIVTLVAHANWGSIFTGWGEACGTGTTKNTTVTVDKELTCTANFKAVPPAPKGRYNLTINVEGKGNGVVTANGTTYKGDGQQSLQNGKTVELKATPDATSTFVGWSGNCSGTTSPLQVKLEQNMTCVATFQSK